MSCKVTKENIIDKIKGDLESRFPNISFIEKDGALKATTNGNLNFFANQLNNNYQSDRYGIIASVEDNNIYITPSQELADAMTEQNKQDDLQLKNKRSFLASREENVNEPQEEATQFTDAKFEGDNHKAFLEFKKEQLIKLQNQYNKIDFEISNTTFLTETNTKSKKKKLKDLGNEISKTKRHIGELQINPDQYIYHAIQEDLYNIKDALEIENSSGQKDVDYPKIKDKLEYYQKFTKNLLQDVIGDNTKLKELNGESSRLIGLAEKKTVEFVINKINEDSIIKEMVEEAEKKGEDPDLFYIEPGKDITLFEQYFMGISSDRTDVTVLPSYILKYWMETL